MMELMAGKATSTHSACDHAVAMDGGTGDITARDHSPGITLTSPPPLVSVLLLCGQFAPPGLSVSIVSWSPHAPDRDKEGVGSGVTHWRYFFFVFLLVLRPASLAESLKQHVIGCKDVGSKEWEPIKS